MAEGDVPFDADWKPSEGVVPEDRSDAVGEPEPDDGERLGEDGALHLHIPTGGEAEALNASDPAPQSEPEQEPITTEAAFLCYLDANGHWTGDPSLVNRKVIVRREAGINDYRHACADMTSDLGAQVTANTVMVMQQQMMINAARQAEAARLGAEAGIPGGGVDLTELRRRAEQAGIRT